MPSSYAPATRSRVILTVDVAVEVGTFVFRTCGGVVLSCVVLSYRGVRVRGGSVYR